MKFQINVPLRKELKKIKTGNLRFFLKMQCPSIKHYFSFKLIKSAYSMEQTNFKLLHLFIDLFAVFYFGFLH